MHSAALAGQMVCTVRTQVPVQPSLQEVQRSMACQTAAAAAGTMLGTRCAYTVQLRAKALCDRPTSSLLTCSQWETRDCNGRAAAADLPLLNAGMQRAPHLQLLAQVVRNRRAGGTQCLPHSHWVWRCASGD